MRQSRPSTPIALPRASGEHHAQALRFYADAQVPMLALDDVCTVTHTESLEVFAAAKHVHRQVLGRAVSQCALHFVSAEPTASTFGDARPCILQAMTSQVHRKIQVSVGA